MASWAIQTGPADPTFLVTTSGASAMDDASTSVRVKIVSGAGAGGVSQQDDTAFTVASDSGTPVGGTYRSVRDAVDDNDFGVFAMTAKRAAYVMLETPNNDSPWDDVNDALRVNVVATSGGGLTDAELRASAVPVSLASVPSHNVTNTGTFAVQAAQSGTWTVQPGNTANTTAWKVDGSAVTQPTKEIRPATPTQSSVASSATNVTVLASNAARLGATVYNDSTQVLYLKLGATASATSYTVQVPASGYYEVPFGYTGVIDGLWASANGNARVTELAA